MIDSTFDLSSDSPDAADAPVPQTVFTAFLQAMRAHQQLMLRKLAEHGAHPGQLFCMRALSAHDGITQRDLAEMLHVARPTVTVMLQKMEKGGLVERRVDERDQRYTRIHLTDDGWALHDQVHGIFDEVIESGLGPMSAEDQKELARLLGELNTNLQATIDAMPPPGGRDHQPAGARSDEPTDSPRVGAGDPEGPPPAPHPDRKRSRP